jgi:hypothetical protein
MLAVGLLPPPLLVGTLPLVVSGAVPEKVARVCDAPL